MGYYEEIDIAKRIKSRWKKSGGELSLDEGQEGEGHSALIG